MASQWSSIFGPDPDMRAPAADREATAERLRASHTEGRLDTDELQERLERCYGAKTVGELKALVTDLPGERQGREHQGQPWFRPWRRRLVPFAPLLIALIVICGLTSHHGGWGFGWLFLVIAFFAWRTCWWRRRLWHGARHTGSDDWV